MPAHDLTVHALDGYPSELGAALWMMEDTRRRTLRAVEGLGDGLVDSLPEGAVNTIGSLLYHVALIEADWLYADILNQPYPHWLEEVFPHDVREEDGRLTRVPPAPLAQHLSRLATVRKHFLTDIGLLTAEDYRRARDVESGTTTPQWVLHHLCQHEGEHRGQIQTIRSLLERR